MFGCYLLEAYSFLKRQKEDESREERRWRGTGRSRGGESIIIMYCMRKESIFNKRKRNMIVHVAKKIRMTTHSP